MKNMSQQYVDIPDTDLLVRLNQNDQKAFTEIYNRYWSAVFLVARNRLHQDQEAEELVQEVFCNLWKRRKSLSVRKNLKAYLAVAVKYEIINRKVQQKNKVSFFQRLARQSSEEDVSTLQWLQFNELEAQLYESILSLPERCRLVFMLRFEKDYSQKEIANELQISEKTVEAHLTKARKLIRAGFGSFFPFL